MTARLPFTQAGLVRAISAAKKAGLCVRGIKPDGTIVVDNADGGVALAPESIDPSPDDLSKWEDVEA